MPVYEYKCRSCLKTYEVIQRFSDAPMSKCPDCGGPVRKLISNTSFVLKGSGWYVTDYARKSGGNEGDAPRKTEEKPEAASEPKPEAGETKAEKSSATTTEKGPATPAA